jgi:anti-sigma factor ChrR (cupin superfamily)
MTGKHLFGNAAELAALYLAGALPADDRAAYEAHLSTGCETCRAELARLDPVARFLLGGAAAVAPDAATREKLLARIAAGDAPPSSQPLFVLRASEGTWEDTPLPGISLKKLFVDRQRRQFTALVRMQAGTMFPRHRHDGAEECLVLEGDLRIGELVLRAGDFQRTPPGFVQADQTTQGGCLLLVTSPFD